VPASVALCPGSSVTLGGAPTAAGGSPPLAYLWSPACGLDDPASANPSASPTATTTYSLTVSDAAGCTLAASETVQLGGGLPGPLGNSLRGVKAGPDAIFLWGSDLAAIDYLLRKDLVKTFVSSTPVATSLVAQTVLAGVIAEAPDLHYYRASARGCAGEGP